MKVSNAKGLGHEKDWVSEDRKATAAGAQIKTTRKGTGGPEPDHKARAPDWDSILS